ncbi:hypothetical protein N7510_004258 [Penicillium lagena]|uniref:uncharacterized protein n=1 Tax=Penicillium lagena TaxID=94218 RepID=UPI0025425DFD|nr:uncharacterized protein N7510_004258 [Penicillium lagena]KAJ5620274.1 hypothetical protein N7510_004258 [Penicillium lagena]
MCNVGTRWRDETRPGRHPEYTRPTETGRSKDHPGESLSVSLIRRMGMLPRCLALDHFPQKHTQPGCGRTCDKEYSKTNIYVGNQVRNGDRVSGILHGIKSHSEA